LSTQVVIEGSSLPGTETLLLCPACDSADTKVLYSAIEDRLFDVPGTWKLWQCLTCDAAFLNPRLTQESIGHAYSRYYTHEAPAKGTLRFRVQGFIADAYAKRRMGSGRGVHLVWSDWIVRWKLPEIERNLAARYRYLPRPEPGAVLLDVGCGNGAFLQQVQALGWQAVGLEMDSNACGMASSRGLNIVQGSVPHTGLSDGSFDVVTLHHVIEHVHDPRAVLREVLRLLRPNGRAVLTTPNWRSYGANLFGQSWRGLEPPRHLVLFTPDGLLRLMGQAGFVTPQIRVRPDLAGFYFWQSYAISQSVPPRGVHLPDHLRIKVKQAVQAARADARQAEEFTLIAQKV
jgi:SAM-dependent methyltransferase